MRDTLRLRARIALLACLPGMTGCSSSPAEADGGKGKRADAKQAPGDAEDGKRGPLRDLKARREARKADADAKAEPATKVAEPATKVAEPADDGEKPDVDTAEPPGVPTTPVPSPDGVVPPPHDAHAGDEVIVGFPGDPPFIDGYNPEESTCVSGNWCGSKSDALLVSVTGVGEIEGCAGRIAGSSKAKDAIAAKPKAYAGLSSAPQMQGALNQHGTELARAKAGGEDTCCYHWFEYCSGRPLLGEHGPVTATVQPGDAWSRPSLVKVEVEVEPVLSAALRQRIARAWLDDALAEHASVAAFARATLELLAVGAPPTLVADAQRAGLDEIEHARLCFSLAGRYGGEAVQPGPLQIPPPRPAGLARLAADTFAEGCLGETIAALAAQRAARGVADPVVKAALERLADDETRHAALAWSTVAWALQQGGRAVADRLLEVATSLSPRDDVLPPEDPHTSTLAAHGRLDPRAHALAGRQAWAEIIEPMLEQLLARSPTSQTNAHA